MSVDADWARVALEVVSLIASGVACFMAWVNRREHANKTALTTLRTELESRIAHQEKTQMENHRASSATLCDVQARLSRMDESLRHVPTERDLNTLSNAVSLVATTVAKLEGAQEANTRMVERMNQFLMERSS